MVLDRIACLLNQIALKILNRISTASQIELCNV